VQRVKWLVYTIVFFISTVHPVQLTVVAGNDILHSRDQI
jgi:hypothetical protein